MTAYNADLIQKVLTMMISFNYFYGGNSIMKKRSTSRVALKIMCAFTAGLLTLQTLSLTALADSKGTVNVNDAKVRADASTDAATLTKVNSGTEVTVTEEKSDSSGNVWYHVTLSDGTSGYIRSDLMTVTASEPAADTSEAGGDEAAADAPQTGGGNVVNGIDVSAISLPDGVSAQDFQSAKMTANPGKVRADASTNDDIVATLESGTDMVVAGSKLGSDSKTWYYVAFLDGGAQKTGYVRSDLVEIGEVIVISPPATPEPAEEEQPSEDLVEPEVNNDYELVFTDDGTGTNVWYLYNHIDNTREKLQELLDYADSQANKSAEYTQKIQKLKILAIVLGVLLGICVVVLVVLVIKLVNSGYEYVDEDEEEEEEEIVTRRDTRDSRKRRHYEEDDEDEEEEEIRRPSTRSRSSRERESVRERETSRDRESSRDREPSRDREQRRSESRDSSSRESSSKQKPKNFMLDDDDFEFEFLDVDDK